MDPTLQLLLTFAGPAVTVALFALTRDRSLMMFIGKSKEETAQDVEKAKKELHDRISRQREDLRHEDSLVETRSREALAAVETRLKEALMAAENRHDKAIERVERAVKEQGDRTNAGIAEVKQMVHSLQNVLARNALIGPPVVPIRSRSEDDAS